MIMQIKRHKVIWFLTFLLPLCVLFFNPNAEAKGKSGKHVNVVITPDKQEDYSIDENASFNIEVIRNKKQSNIKLDQIEAAFPDEETPVTLTKLGKGEFTYTTEVFTEEGEKTLFVTVYTHGAAKKIRKLLEKIEQAPEEKIEKLKARLEKTRQKGIIGWASYTISVVSDLPEPPPSGSDAGYINGVVYDGETGLPLAQAIVSVNTVMGAVLTDEEGRYIFPIIGYPLENKKAVIITIEKSGYTYAQRRVTVTTTRDVSAEAAYLIPLDPQTTLITPSGGTATNATGTIEVVIPEGAISEDININATEYKKAEELPNILPESSFFTYALDLNPDGTSFSQPVTVRIANSRGFTPGTPVPVGYYNKSTALWEPESMGEVTSDGQWVEFAVTHFSPRDCNLPVSAPAGSQGPEPNKIGDETNNDETKDIKDPGVSIRSGSLILEHSLPATKRLGRTQGLKFTYSSTSANPSVFVGTETTLSPPIAVPDTSGWILDIEGVRKDVRFKGKEGKARQAYLFNAKNARGVPLATGSYPYALQLTNDYLAEYFTASFFGGPPEEPTGVYSDELVPLTSAVSGRIIVNNQQASPFGAGWTLSGLERLYFDPDGKILLTEGNGSTSVFTPDVSIFPEPFVSGIALAPILLTIGKEGNFYVPHLTVDPGPPPTPRTSIQRITPDGVKESYGEIPSLILDMAFDLVGNLYANDITGGIIYQITPDGTTTAFADGFAYPFALTFDRQGVFYVSDGYGIHKVTPNTKEMFVQLSDLMLVAIELVFDNQGNLYATVSSNPFGAPVPGQEKVIKINPAGEFSTFAEGFTSLRRLTFDDEGNLYGIDSTTTVFRITPEGKVKAIFEGGGKKITGMAFDSLGNLYFLDANDLSIYKIVMSRDLVLSYMPSLGDFSELTRNVADNTYIRTLKDGTQTHFDSQGLHISTVDRNGNTTVYTYDDVNGDEKIEELITITGPTGDITQFIYDSRGYLLQIIDPAGRDSFFTIDADDNLAYITTPDGEVTEYKYNENHLIDTVTDPEKRVTQYNRTIDGRYNQIIFASGETIDFVSSELQGLINNLPDGTGTPDNPADAVEAEIPDLLTNGKGETTTYLTSKFGAPIKEKDPLGNETITERDADSNPISITRPNGSRTIFTYDYMGNLLTITQEAIGATTTFTYEPDFNQVTSIKDPKGSLTQIDYDEKGNPIKITDALSNITTMDYDTRGLLILITDAEGNETQFAYDPQAGNLISVTDPLGSTAVFIYDIAGNIESSEDALGRITQYEYNTMNRLISTTDTHGSVTSYEYDQVGNLTSIADANLNKTTFEYNEVNLLVKTINPLGEEKTFTYDLNRNLASATDAKGQTITYVYDVADRLIQKTLPDDLVTFGYDSISNLTLAGDSDSKLIMAYDPIGRLVTVITGDPGNPAIIQPITTTTYTYDKNSNRLLMNGPTGTTQYVYDALNRLAQIVSPGLQATTYTYDTLSRLKDKTLPNGIVTTYTYDEANRLVNIQSPVVSYQYTHDEIGNRTTMTDMAGLHSYTYDDLSRITQATYPAIPTEFFTYDEVGNRLSSNQHTTWIYDDANRLNSYGGISLTYDNNGNATSKTESSSITTYTYSVENQLTRVDFSSGGFAEYSYDALGRRIEKDANGTITRYVYDGEDMISEYNGSNILTAAYTHGPGIDEPLMMARGGQSYYYHADGLGSIAALTDSGGTVAQSYSYDAFGNIVNTACSVANPYTYTAREYDSETDLYYYRARYYSSLTGRFLQEDPIGHSGGMNLYAYVNNNPVNWIDPLGLSQEDIQKAYGWLRDQHPEVAEGAKPVFIEVDLPGDVAGMALPFNAILIDPNYESKDWLVDTVAHELMHTQKGFLGNLYEDLITGSESHQEIYNRAEQIRRDYLKWVEGQKVKEPSKKK